MDITYRIIGFNDYEFRGKILYRKAYKTKSKSCKFQYRSERKINTANNGIIGYILVNEGKRKFYSLTSLKHRLKLIL